MKMLKSRDPRIDACGTPAIIISHSLNESLILQLWYLFEAVFKLRPPALSFAARRLRFKVSNALKRSIIITPTFFFLFDCVFQFSVILSSAYCALWFFRKPVRNLEDFVSINSFSWLYIASQKLLKNLTRC